MSLLDTLRKNLEPELFEKVTDSLGDDFNYDLVPRSRLNKVIAQRDKARELASGSTQPDKEEEPDRGFQQFQQGFQQQSLPGATAKPNEGPTQQQLEEAVKKEREAGEQKLRELQLRYAVTEKLRESKFTDPELVLSAGLVDFSKLTVENGKITAGLDEQVTAIAEAKPFLVATQTPLTGTGRQNASDNFGSISSRDEFLKLSTEDQLKFKTAYPDMFKTFLGQL